MSKTSDFFAYQQKRSQSGSRCRVCQHDEARQAVRDILKEAVKRGQHITQRALGEWIVKTYNVNLRPNSIVGHLTSHEGELWEQVRG